MLDDIISLINYIGNLHKEFSNDFFSDNISINLKSTTITKIVDDKTYDGKFIELIETYIDQLAFFQIFYDFKSSNPNIETRFRGKNFDSTLNKIYYYRFGKENNGVPIQKSINDLFGFRIIINSNDSYDKLKEIITNSEKLNVEIFRPYIRKDNGYTGLHIYFRSESNFYFPWELQIWKKTDEIQNELSHKEHKEKRDYQKWSNKYTNSKRREE